MELDEGPVHIVGPGVGEGEREADDAAVAEDGLALGDGVEAEGGEPADTLGVGRLNFYVC